jgi:hypothetical protein
MTGKNVISIAERKRLLVMKAVADEYGISLEEIRYNVAAAIQRAGLKPAEPGKGDRPDLDDPPF